MTNPAALAEADQLEAWLRDHQAIVYALAEQCVLQKDNPNAKMVGLAAMYGLWKLREASDGRFADES